MFLLAVACTGLRGVLLVLDGMLIGSDPPLLVFMSVGTFPPPPPPPGGSEGLLSTFCSSSCPNKQYSAVEEWKLFPMDGAIVGFGPGVARGRG